jgi:hypothetical protein
MEETEQQNFEWRKDISEPKTVLKVADGESKVFVFQDEGVKIPSVDYGTSIAFAVIEEGTTKVKTFYVKANNFSFLSQIKALGTLKNLKVRVSRTGSKRSDTRYTIVKV